AGEPFTVTIETKITQTQFETENPMFSIGYNLDNDFGNNMENALSDWSISVGLKPKVVIDCNLADYITELDLPGEHPWVDGAQDLTKISVYQKIISVTSEDFALIDKNNFPLLGDSIQLKFKFSSDISMDKLYVRLIDNSYEANWWRELQLKPGQEARNEETLITTNIEAGEIYPVDMNLPIRTSPAGDVTLCFWYEVQDVGGSEESPATLTITSFDAE
ncbi:MAG: hypothetical protein MJ188_04590, partial [Treponema sp.]|nr:hypothetical protein [Treponema sp.]